jgi:dehydrogenase/reductase SDR family member 7B
MFKDKVVWITGASAGIGAALAKRFAAQGALLILSGRRTEALEKVAADCLPAASIIIAFEATDYARLPDCVDEALAWKGRIDVLVNNAGISQRSLALDTDFQVYRDLMEVDFFAPLKLTQLVLPHMVERKSGALIQIASVAGKIGAPLRSGYCSAKHALVGYSDALRAEVSKQGIAVHVITPGFIKTDIARNALRGDGNKHGSNARDPVDNGMDVDKAASVIVTGVAAGKREIAVGQGQEMQALWLKRFLPNMLFNRVESLAQGG